MSTLARCIDRLIARHGSLRGTARAAGIDASYLSRLRAGEKDAPSDAVLAALGLERVVSYRVSKEAAQPFPRMSRADAAAYHGDIDGDFNY